MRRTIGLIGLVGLATLLAACSAGPSNTYTITGEFIAVQPDEPEGSESEATEESASDEVASSEASETEPVEEIDLSTATVVVSYETVGDDGEDVTVELTSGSFADGTVAISGEIDVPTDVTLSVDVGEEEPLTVSALLSPGSEVSFVLVDHLDPRPPQLSLYGEAKDVRDPTKRFSISGDLSSLDKDLSLGSVGVSGPGWDEDGEETFVSHGSVLLRDGRFLIESEIDEPTVLSLVVSAGREYYGNVRFVVEPNVNVEVSNRGAARELLATAKTGRNAEVVESWQQSDEYLAKLDEYTAAMDAYVAEMDARRAAAESGENADDAPADGESEEESTEQVADAEAENEEPEPILALADGIPVADGCEHVSLADVKPGIMDAAPSSEAPEYFAISQELGEIRSKVLDDVASSSEDPLTALLALEMGAFGRDNRSEALRVYDELATKLDDDVVARRVTPSRETIAKRIQVEENDKGLVPGQRAPEFTLASLDGDDVALYDVLAEKEIVLVDFWASWCGPCIATFPDLKKFHAAYNDDGFEIVAVSIDSTHEAWQTGSEKHELPWINLGEIEGWEGEVAASYGVQFIPKGYLLDQEGCVIQKDLRPEKLKEVLVARYGEAPELVEPEEQQEEESATDPGADDVGG